MADKAYLGDSVYVAQNLAGHLVLTTDNGFGPTNIIILEPEVYEALEAYVTRLRKPPGEG